MAAPATNRIPRIGATLGGRYRVDALLGEGGMGTVFAARDLAGERDVALKLLHAGGDVNEERFVREVRLVSRLRSAHVARVLGTGIHDERPFFVMERLDGDDFGRKLRVAGRGGGLPIEVVVDCVVQACEALAHAHVAGIVHRDVKASNLFEHRPENGEPIVKVLDFGISKLLPITGAEGGAVERTLTRTRDGGFLGSPPYMSPEHVRDPRNVDPRADQWSLGVVLYRLLSARFPFDGDTTGEVLAAILERPAVPLRTLGVDVAPTLEGIVLRCLARAREDRFADVGELAAALAPFASARWQAYGDAVPEILRAPAQLGPAIDLLPMPRGPREAPPVDEPRTRTVPPPVVPPQVTSAGPPATRTRWPTVGALLLIGLIGGGAMFALGALTQRKNVESRLAPSAQPNAVSLAGSASPPREPPPSVASSGSVGSSSVIAGGASSSPPPSQRRSPGSPSGASVDASARSSASGSTSGLSGLSGLSGASSQPRSAGSRTAGVASAGVAASATKHELQPNPYIE